MLHKQVLGLHNGTQLHLMQPHVTDSGGTQYL